MAVITLEPTVLSNVEGPFDAVWDLVGKEASLLNYETPQTEVVLPGEEKLTDGTNQGIVNIAWEFKTDESLIIRHEKPIKYITELCEINDKVDGNIDELCFIKKWRWSIDNINWTNWLDFDQLPEKWNWLDDLYVEWKYICLLQEDFAPDDTPVNPDPSLFLYFVNINGTLEQERTNQKVTLTEPDQCIVLSPDDKWKVFKLIDFILVAGGQTPDRRLEMKFRGSTVSGRQWTEWQPMTTSNLQHAKLDPLRFWYLEVQFCRVGSDMSGEIKIWDLELIGDFQNVSDNYSKMGKLGFRSDCRNLYSGIEPCDDTLAYPPPEFENYEKCDSRFQDNKWNPYDLKATELYKKFTEDINQLFGWKTVYYKTDPDQKGRDVVLHEYQLTHVIAEDEVKIVVPKNQFPDNKVLFTAFDLDMFDNWTVHITRDEFKKVFGIEERPRKWDMLYLCETNRLYQVTHAQAHKDFLNTSVYYEVTLEKAQNNLNVKADPEIEESLKQLTENNSLDALFSEEVKQETKNISNTEQLQVLTKDEIRKEINGYTRIVDLPIENGPNIISKNYYDFGNVSPDEFAITYANADYNIAKGQDRGFVIWFNLKTKNPGTIYNLLTNQAVINNQPFGYKFSYMDNRIDVEWNDQFFEWFIPELQTNHWYALVASMNQKLAKWEYFIYRRRSDINPRSYADPQLVLVKSETGKLEPVEWNITANTVIHGSEIKITNVRVFSEIINVNDMQMILSQYIIRESGKLIFADNATSQLYLPSLEYRAHAARNI